MRFVRIPILLLVLMLVPLAAYCRAATVFTVEAGRVETRTKLVALTY